MLKKRYSLWTISVALFFFWLFIGMPRVVPKIVPTAVKFLFIVTTLLGVIKNKYRINIEDSVCAWGICYIFLSAFSVLISKFLSMSLVMAEIQFVLVNICCFVIPERYFKNALKKYMDFLTIVMVISIIFSAVTAAFGKVTFVNGERINYLISPWLGQRKMGKIGHYGYSSIFSNPNPFGFYIVAAIAWVLATKEKKLSTVIELLILTGGLLLPNSRAAYLGFFSVIVIYAYERTNSARTKILICSAVFFAGVILLTFFGGRIYEILIAIDLNGRQSAWEAMLNSIRENFWVGTGFSSGTKGVIESASGTFSAYLTIFVDTGLCGMILFLMMIVTTLGKTLKFIHHDKENGFLFFYVMFTFLMLLVGFVESVFMNITGRYLLWLFASRIACNECKA